MTDDDGANILYSRGAFERESVAYVVFIINHCSAKCKTVTDVSVFNKQSVVIVVIAEAEECLTTAYNIVFARLRCYIASSNNDVLTIIIVCFPRRSVARGY